MIQCQKLGIMQRKGEAEMAQVDWLAQFKEDDNLRSGDSVVSIVTSGDIDAVVIHLFYVSQHWPRNDGKFNTSVYVILQKPSGSTVYNITSIIELLEKNYPNDSFISAKLAMVLCIGGNDFIPKMEWISHNKICQLFFTEEQFRNGLFNPSTQGMVLDISVYLEFVKYLYFKKSMGNICTITFEDVRKATIQRKKAQKEILPTGLSNTSDPSRWLPPRQALLRMANLIQLQIEYLPTAGYSSAKLPLSYAVQLTPSGAIEYDLGENS